MTERRTRVSRVLPLLFTIAVSGCTELCPLSVSSAIVIDVRDAITGLPLAAASQAIVRRESDGIAVDTLRSYAPPEDTTASELASTRIGAGRYRVIITRAGYLPWERQNVEVRDVPGDCGGVRTVQLRAALLPAT